MSTLRWLVFRLMVAAFELRCWLDPDLQKTTIYRNKDVPR